MKLADLAIHRYLEPQIAAGTAKDALETLLSAFQAVRTDSAVALAIRIDLAGRIQSISEQELIPG